MMFWAKKERHFYSLYPILMVFGHLFPPLKVGGGVYYNKYSMSYLKLTDLLFILLQVKHLHWGVPATPVPTVGNCCEICTVYRDTGDHVLERNLTAVRSVGEPSHRKKIWRLTGLFIISHEPFRKHMHWKKKISLWSMWAVYHVLVRWSS